MMNTIWLMPAPNQSSCYLDRDQDMVIHSKNSLNEYLMASGTRNILEHVVIRVGHSSRKTYKPIILGEPCVHTDLQIT